PRAAVGAALVGDGWLHVVGGSGEGRYDAAHHHVYEPCADRWHDAAPLPRGANQVGIAVLGARLYAVGGFLGPGHTPIADCHAYDPATDRWQRSSPLALPRGAVGLAARDGTLHAVGGATGTTDNSRRSSDLHETYDPETDRWVRRAPLPLARDRATVLVLDGRIHALGGRSDGQFRALNAHDVYLPRSDQWERAAPLPFGRAGLGVPRYRDRLFVIGGEEFAVNRHEGERRIVGKVYGTNEGYDAEQDKWEQYAPLPTPRHGFACAVMGEAIHVIGGAPMPGGEYQTAVHDAFTLD
ncbi:MAG: galactose oxidase, partial [Alphaproteobacteria bacterium]|nr:galactose oxidase [Alphaproteobacteria bacterium]